MVKPLRDTKDIKTIENLLKFLDMTYDDPDKKGTAERELAKLKQGNKEFASHFSEFQSIMAILQWDEKAKKAALYSTISDTIKDSLAASLYPVPEDYMSFVGLVQRLDQQLRARTEERRGKPQTHQAPRAPKPNTANESSNPRDSWSNSGHTGAAPVDLSAQRKSAEQQALFERRRAEGACTLCGDKTHWRRDCPRRHRRPIQAAAATTTTPAPTTTAPRITEVTDVQSGN